MMNIENIPPELMLDIFSRLPVKSLCVTKSVCKHWYHLTRDPQLPHMHLARNEEEALILASWYPETQNINHVFLPEHYTSAEPIFDVPKYCKVQVSFDGLLLAYNLIDRKAFLCNPLTGDHLDLPPSRDTILWNYMDSKAYFGLGFDSSIRKYKAVCAYFGDFDLFKNRCRTGALVCTINGAASSSWRDIVSQPTVPIDECKRSVYASGAQHWMAQFGFVDRRTMGISFDFEKEEFKTLPCSGFFSAANSDKFNLIDLRGYLGMVDLSHRNHIEIWKLENYDRNEWVREYNIGLDSKVKVLYLTREAEIVMLRYYNSPLFVGDARDAIVFVEDDEAFHTNYVGWNKIAQQMSLCDQLDFDMRNGGWYVALVAYNPKTATLRIIHRFYVTKIFVFLYRPSLVSLSM